MRIQKGIVLAAALLITIITVAQKNEVINQYIQEYRAIAVEEMQRTGVPAAIKLAQGIHETMAGQSPLVLKSNNHFGIKCKSGYTGAYVLHDDDAPNERFMKYDNAEQSYKDHSDFLKSRSRYAALFQLDPTDYKNWAYGLKQAGYATNPKYPQIIISLIEKYNLQDYSLMALGKMEMSADLQMAVNSRKGVSPAAASMPVETAMVYPQNVFTINETKVVYVPKGTQLQHVADEHHVPMAHLLLFNDFRTNEAKAPKDQLVYLQLKRTMGMNAYHEVKEGETIYDIAQTEGIRLESLLKYNGLTKFNAPVIGSKLSLQQVSEKATAVN